MFILPESRTYLQTDGVAMGLPIGPVLVDIFMIELESHFYLTWPNI